MRFFLLFLHGLAERRISVFFHGAADRTVGACRACWPHRACGAHRTSRTHRTRRACSARCAGCAHRTGRTDCTGWPALTARAGWAYHAGWSALSLRTGGAYLTGRAALTLRTSRTHWACRTDRAGAASHSSRSADACNGAVIVGISAQDFRVDLTRTISIIAAIAVVGVAVSPIETHGIPSQYGHFVCAVPHHPMPERQNPRTGAVGKCQPLQRCAAKALLV